MSSIKVFTAGLCNVSRMHYFQIMVFSRQKDTTELAFIY